MTEVRKYGQIFEAQNGNDVKQAVMENSKVVVDFTAQWCGPCRKLFPILEEFAKTNDTILFLKVDVDNSDCTGLVESCKVTSLPTLQLYYNKDLLTDVIGFDKNVIEEGIRNLININDDMPSLET